MKKTPADGRNSTAAPLAYRMRPRKFNEFIGQNSIIGPGTPLRRAIERDRLHSIILYGPAGTGKTSLAGVIAEMSEAVFERLSAVSASVQDVRKIIGKAVERKLAAGRTVLFIDEIHRFNKNQQDALLPAVEEGTLVLIGATTENPFFEVNSPLISRSQIYVFKPLAAADIKKIVRSALKDKDRGLGEQQLSLKPKALNALADLANGDARRALNILEGCARLLVGPDKVISEAAVKEAAGRRSLGYDKAGDAHYDTISAFIKSLRGSNPDAALHWLARMIEAGEDPKFIARRMVIFASEDIGNADPQALLVATAAAQAVQFVGLPECRLNLAQAAIYLAIAAKSNAVITAINSAQSDLRDKNTGGVPKHLKDSSYAGAKKLGHGRDYKYPHNFPGHWVDQDYLPENLKGKEYYHPSNSGLEKKISEHLSKLRKKSPKNS